MEHTSQGDKTIQKRKQDQKKRKETGMVMQSLVMLFQFGINMIVPILMCTLFGVWLGNKTGLLWISVPLFFVGALAGANNIWRMARKMIDSDQKDHRKSRGKQDR